MDLQVDELTGVYKRETFVRLLDRIIREECEASAVGDKRRVQHFSLLFIEINKFKPRFPTSPPA